MNSTPPTPAALARLEFARQIAVEAGQFTLQYFCNSSLTFERKSDDSPVTIADKGAETLLRERITARFPEDAIVGEEHGVTAGDSGYRWILDPIDGTKSFITGVPLYGILVGMEHNGQPLVGVTYLPALDECYYACIGGGAWLSKQSGEPTPLKVSETKDLNDAIFLTSQVDTFAQRSAEVVFEKLQSACYITRTWGDCYGHMLVASGRADVMIDPLMNIWDAAALYPIIVEAGGQYLSWKGEARIDGGDAISTNAALAEQVLKLTAR
jgi:histidinol-phosphatase